MTAQTSRAQTIAVAGAGLIGLACAFELASRGHDVTLFDPAPPQKSTGWAAAGMIAPAYELMLQPGAPDEAFGAFCFDSAALWKEFAARIEAETGVPLGYSSKATLALARTAEEEDRLTSLRGHLDEMGHPARPLSPAALEFNFGLAPGLRGGLLLAQDHQVDNRRVISALRRLFEGQGRVLSHAVSTRDEMEAHAGRAFETIVWARGAAESGVMKQVKGQAIALSPIAGLPRNVLRFGPRYIVPKADRLIVGATSEPDYSAPGVDPAVARTLFEEAAAILPALRQADLVEHWAGLRPQAGGHRPLIGRCGETEFIATAHYRNGVLLAPATARLIADQVEGLTLPDTYTQFAPRQVPGESA